MPEKRARCCTGAMLGGLAKARAEECKGRMFSVAILSIDNVEDIDIIGLLITGISLLGVGSFLIFRNISACGRSFIWKVKELPTFMDGVGWMINTQTHALTELNRKVDTVLELLRNMEKYEE